MGDGISDRSHQDGDGRHSAVCPKCGKFRGGHACGSFDICCCHSPTAPAAGSEQATARVDIAHRQQRCSVQRLVRALCLESLRDYRAYRKIHPEAFQAWACSERKGAAKLARKIARLLKRPNTNAGSGGEETP